MFFDVSHCLYLFISTCINSVHAVPAILNEAVPATTQNVDLEITGTIEQAFKYTSLIENMISNTELEGPSIQLLKEALINSRQHEAFLRILLVSGTYVNMK